VREEEARLKNIQRGTFPRVAMQRRASAGLEGQVRQGRWGGLWIKDVEWCRLAGTRPAVSKFERSWRRILAEYSQETSKKKGRAWRVRSEKRVKGVPTSGDGLGHASRNISLRRRHLRGDWKCHCIFEVIMRAGQTDWKGFSQIFAPRQERGG